MLARCLASSPRSSAVSTLAGPSTLPVSRLSRRSIYSTPSRRYEDGAASVASSSASFSTTPQPSTSSATSSTKAPALFTALPPGTSPKPRRPYVQPEPKANRLREHLNQWPAFVDAEDEFQDQIEDKIRKRVKQVVGISTTMAKWYSDPIPYLYPAPIELFGCERMRSQTLKYEPRVGDRVRTSFNSYGTITAIRPAAIRPIDPAKLKAKAPKEPAAMGSRDYVDPTAKKSDRNKVNIEMPPDWVLKTSKQGPTAGAVQKKELENEAKRVLAGGKPKPASSATPGKSGVEEKVEKPKMVAEIRIETELVEPDPPRSHPVGDLLYAPLSPSNLAALQAETSHSSIAAALASGYTPSPADIITASWGSPPKSLIPQTNHPLRPLSQPLPMRTKQAWAGQGVAGRGGYVERREAQMRELKGGEELTGAERRLLDREKRKVWEEKKEGRVRMAVHHQGGEARWRRDKDGKKEGLPPRKWESFDEALEGGAREEVKGRRKGGGGAGGGWNGFGGQRREKAYGLE